MQFSFLSCKNTSLIQSNPNLFKSYWNFSNLTKTIQNKNILIHWYPIKYLLKRVFLEEENCFILGFLDDLEENPCWFVDFWLTSKIKALFSIKSKTKILGSKRKCYLFVDFIEPVSSLTLNTIAFSCWFFWDS